MSSPAANFDPLARIYRALEWLAFGGDLERARFCLLDQLAGRRSILILGEGDGRCLERLLPLVPDARIDCLDASPAMLARAETRIAGADGRGRVTFICADALSHALPAAHYDAVVTLFFLDCFEPPSAEALVNRITAAVQPGAGWLFADFVVPTSGLARLRARLWLAGLYTFFRWQTGLRPRALPPSEELIRQADFGQSVPEFPVGAAAEHAVRRDGERWEPGQMRNPGGKKKAETFLPPPSCRPGTSAPARRAARYCSLSGRASFLAASAFTMSPVCWAATSPRRIVLVGRKLFTMAQ